jgi:hypothetical protein
MFVLFTVYPREMFQYFLIISYEFACLNIINYVKSQRLIVLERIKPLTLIYDIRITMILIKDGFSGTNWYNQSR